MLLTAPPPTRPVGCRDLQRLVYLDIVEGRVGVVDVQHGEERVHAAWLADDDAGIAAH